MNPCLSRAPIAADNSAVLSPRAGTVPISGMVMLPAASTL
jgi:hypothetical protein